MKKIFKLTFLFVLTFVFFGIISVNASSCDDLTSEDAKAACKQVEAYCAKDEGGEKGCIYNPNDKKYTQVSGVSNWNGTRGTFKSGTAQLVRGYSAVDKNNNAIFIGCYIYENPKAQGGSIATVGAMDWPKGTYFIFKFMTPDKAGGCKNTTYDIVPAGTFGNFDGHNAIGTDSATYYWTATQKGSCPLMFAITGNTTSHTADRNKFIFADNENQIKNFDKSQFRFLWWNSEKYVVNLGCTVQDKEGYEAAIKCYDDAINEIKNKPCAADISDISQYQSQLENLANKCSSSFEVLYKNELLRSNATTFKRNLSNAINQKLTSCQYTDCKLSASNITSLTNALSSKSCKDGCAGKEGTEYENCISCLKSAYNSCGLSATQIQCLLDSQKAKDEAQSELEDEVDKDQEQHVQDELAEAQEKREQLYDRFSEKAIVKDPSVPEGNLRTCDEILGKNLAAVVRASITILQIVGAIIAIVKGMMTLIPPILAKDADALKKAGKTLTTMAIVLVIIFLIRPLLAFIGNIVDFDTSCIL